MMDLSMELSSSSFPFSKIANLDDVWKPKVGMEFDSLEAAWKFWANYGGKTGFGVRKQYTNKRKKDGSITSCRFVCCKEGLRREDKRNFPTTSHRLETRTNCKARMGVVHTNGKYKVHDFVEEHNHILHIPEITHMSASQHNLSQFQDHDIDLVDDSGIQQRASLELMSRHMGGTCLGQNNYLRTKRQRSLVYGEAGCLLQYFQRQVLENPWLYHALQMDIEEQITNVFWVDARMLIDYDYFGDVVSLKTQYCTNNAYRPLVLFSGFNHYREVVIFGAALLYDETLESFKWLFETFLEVHKQKKPQTIFTDQGQTIANALHEVMPDTCHGLCIWHLIQNGIKHLGNLMKNESQFLIDFKACIYRYEEETQFEAAWSRLLSDYDVHEKSWLKSMYNIKEKWAAYYMKKAFTLGMQSTQLSESLNSEFRSCMKPNLDIIQFFKHFERIVENKRYNEMKCEFKSQHKLPILKCENSPMLQQLAQIYTFTIFDLFQIEFDLCSAACIKHRDESQLLFEYVITMVNQEGEWKVSFDPCHRSISCSCRKFETFGILCCHALKVFDVKDIKLVPDQYILKRWTKEARSRIMHDAEGKEVEGDTKLDSKQRFRQLCPKLIRLATEVSSCQEAFLLVNKAVDELSKQVIKFCKRLRSVDNDNGNTTTQVSDLMVQSNSTQGIQEES